MLNIKYHSILLGVFCSLVLSFSSQNANPMAKIQERINVSDLNSINKSTAVQIKQTGISISRQPLKLEEVFRKFQKRALMEKNVAIDFNFKQLMKHQKYIQDEFEVLANSKHPILNNAGAGKLRMVVIQSSKASRGCILFTGINIPLSKIPYTTIKCPRTGTIAQLRTKDTVFRKYKTMKQGNFKNKNDKLFIEEYNNPSYIVIPVHFLSIYKYETMENEDITNTNSIIEDLRVKKRALKRERFRILAADGFIEQAKDKIHAEIKDITEVDIRQLNIIFNDASMVDEAIFNQASRVYMNIVGNISEIKDVLKLLANPDNYSKNEKQMPKEELYELNVHMGELDRHLVALEEKINKYKRSTSLKDEDIPIEAYADNF